MELSALELVLAPFVGVVLVLAASILPTLVGQLAAHAAHAGKRTVPPLPPARAVAWRRRA